MAVSREYVDGEVSEIYDADSGAVKADGDPTEYPFEQRGAQLEFVVREKVTFLKISLPNGKVIVKEVGKK